ncbi:hypothetical protein PMKS-001989 [Pichia membranifaciens]|uniref:Uncharacterized protein n=1 Tax=Pichia membranifaciens TaxID=4926 RepID=A0A1Q2YG75_9ASCO|nr:hypothetical protein PMKS-001989 [Pichia membranifaciens]
MGGHSIYGEKGAPPPKDADPQKFGPLYSGLEDENFVLSHNKLGRVSVANAGSNTGGKPYTEGAPLLNQAAEDDPAAGTGGAVNTSPDGQQQQQQTQEDSNQAYAEDHPSGRGGSYHHYVFVPFTVFIFIAGLMAYKNRRNVSMMVRGPRYRRVSGMNV